MSSRRQPPPIGDDNPPTPPPRRVAPPQEPAPAVEADQSVAVPGEGALSDVLGESTGTDISSIVDGLVRLRRKAVDPMEDWVADGTRQLRWIQAAIAHQAAMTNSTQQKVLRDALLGEAPLSPEFLDAYHREFYGKPRR